MEGRTRAGLSIVEDSGGENQRIETQISVSANPSKSGFQQTLCQSVYSITRF